MNRKVVLLMDIGGTHCRSKLVQGSDCLFDEDAVIDSRTAKISDKQAFLTFIDQLAGSARGKAKPHQAVLCFAGPVVGGSISMLNWSGQAEITTRELVEAGLPPQGITLLNDMEAAAYALLAWNSGHISLDPDPLYTAPAGGNKRNNNALLLMPGTGIGVSAVIDNNSGHPRGSPQVLACEMQHTPIPVLDEQQESVLNDMKNKHAIKQPSWEDFISGRGLENIYRCLAPRRQSAGVSGLNAQDIAGYAVQGADGYCVSALNMFYQCCGALAQLLALTFQPYAGIYLAGESTRRNLSFIRNSPFLQQLQHSDVRGYLLREFPVSLLAQELNLYGAAYAAGLGRQDCAS